MKSFNSLLLSLMLALGTLGLSNAIRIPDQDHDVGVLTRQDSECSPAEWVECIVSLAELPLQITTCLEALNDIGESAEDPESVDPLQATIQGADCIAEATLAAVELPSHCAGCTAVLDGECPNADVPCTGPPPADGRLPGRR